MRVLWIARTCPYPPNDGEKLRVFNLLKALGSRHELTIVYREMDDDEQASSEVLRSICRGGVHAVRVPRPKGWLQRLRWLLPFVLSRYPIALCTVYFEPIRQVLARLAAEKSFDVVQVEHSSLAIYMDRVMFSSRPATVLTMHNIDYIRNERLVENTPIGLTWLYYKLNQLRFKRWELEVLRQFDQVISMSALDRHAMLTEVPTLAVRVVPNGVDVDHVPYAPAPAACRNVVFVASMDSEANHDGAMFLLREVWPLVASKCPDARLLFVGRNPQRDLRAAHDGNTVIVTGTVSDVMTYYREAAVAVVPLRSGGGTRLKILEAMAAGVPVVSTTVGCEGLELVQDRDLIVADAADAIATAVAQLLENPGLRSDMAAQARQTVERTYDWRFIAASHDDVYEAAVAGRV